MRNALVAEYRKLVSTRAWWVLALVLVGYLAFIGAVMAFSLTSPDAQSPGMPRLDGEAAATAVYGLVNAIGYVFPLLVGSLAMTSEFRHRTITQSLLVEPDRTVFLAAKVASSVPVGVFYGVLGGVGIVAGAAPLLSWLGDGAYLSDPDVWETLLLGVGVTVLWTIIGVALGMVLTNQVVAIVVILAFTQFVEPVARVALGSFAATDGVAQYLPGAAADAIIGSSLFAAMSGGSGDLLPRWAGILVLLAYAAALVVLGRLTTLRRDVG